MHITSETTNTQPPVDMRPAIIELLYAAKTLAVRHDNYPVCLACGVYSFFKATDPKAHRTYCPVARVYAAIESVREVLL